ncbi:MAG: HD domain-containing protein [Clostridia bacterium]|nr:HD domain-containing protein [Clostridia bacterium]
MDISREYKYIDRFVRYTRDLLCDPLVESMKQYRHHGDTSTHYHSVFVAYSVCKMCTDLHAWDARDIVRAALLHDFYLYEWYTEKHDENHIWYHPKESVKNIEAHFGPMRGVQRNMILAHMFPLCKELPHSSGAWMLTLADKRCACEDYLGASRRFRPVYDEIDRRAKL